MKVFIIVICVIVVLVIVAVVSLIVRAVVGSSKVYAKIKEQVYQVIMDIDHGGESQGKLLSLAKNLNTRGHLYRKLYEKGWIELFPEQYKSIEKIAESDLAVWLMHPNELNAVPDEIELVHIYEKKDIDNGISQYFLFKFRTFEPHWASNKGWVAGMAGPYKVGEEPLYSPPCVFSRFEEFSTRTPEEHCEIAMQTVYNGKGIVYTKVQE